MRGPVTTSLCKMTRSEFVRKSSQCDALAKPGQSACSGMCDPEVDIVIQGAYRGGESLVSKDAISLVILL